MTSFPNGQILYWVPRSGKVRQVSVVTSLVAEPKTLCQILEGPGKHAGPLKIPTDQLQTWDPRKAPRDLEPGEKPGPTGEPPAPGEGGTPIPFPSPTSS